jgi:hypothetical protein
VKRPAAGNLYEAAEALHRRMVEEGVDLPRPANVPGGLGRFARALWGHLSVEHGLPRPSDDDPALLRFLTAAWTAVEGAELEKAQGPLGRSTAIVSPVGQATHTYTEDPVTLQAQITALSAQIDALNAPESICKAWINFNGTGTIAIRDSFNVSGIVDNGGVGNYTVTWDRDFASADYVIGGVAGGATGPNKKIVLDSDTALAVGSARFRTHEGTIGYGDCSFVLLKAFGVQA